MILKNAKGVKITVGGDALSAVHRLKNGKQVIIRNAKLNDCGAIMDVLNACISEKNRTSLTQPIRSVKEEEKFFISLDKREGIIVCELNQKIVGFVTLYLYNKIIESTRHVGGVGSFVLSNFRGMGVGTALIKEMFNFARKRNYEKLIAEVRRSNKKAKNFYQKMGFKKVGKLTNQIKIEGKYDDVIVMEAFL